MARVARTGIFPLVALLGAAMTLAAVAPTLLSAPPMGGPTPNTRCETIISALDHVALAAPSWSIVQSGADAPSTETAVARACEWSSASPAVEHGRCGGGPEPYIGQGSFRS